jgi:hypothetical protein
LIALIAPPAEAATEKAAALILSGICRITHWIVITKQNHPVSIFPPSFSTAGRTVPVASLLQACLSFPNIRVPSVRLSSRCFSCGLRRWRKNGGTRSSIRHSVERASVALKWTLTAAPPMRSVWPNGMPDGTAQQQGSLLTDTLSYINFRDVISLGGKI